MTDAAIGSDRFEFGRVVGRTFALLGRNFAMFLVLALIFVGIPQFALEYGQSYIIATRPDLVIAVSLVALVVTMVTNFILQGALTRAAVDDLAGKGARLGAALGDGLMYFFPLFIVALLVSIGLMIGFVILIIPGILLAVRWAVAAPVVVVEREGPTRSIGRSAELTQDHRWAVLGLFLLFFIFAYAVQIGLALSARSFGIDSAPGTITMDTMGIVFAAISAAIGSLVTLVGTLGTASLYFELRSVKDGVGFEEIAKVFD
jgi:Membrane domain of glycerophosphoryl diester phosphodiesterase